MKYLFLYTVIINANAVAGVQILNHDAATIWRFRNGGAYGVFPLNEKNFQKNEIKYPVGKVKGSSKKYTAYNQDGN